MSTFTFQGNGKEMGVAMARLSRSLPKKSTLPILSCVALRFVDGAVEAVSTNLDQCHRLTLPTTSATGTKGAGACVALGLFTALLARCNGDVATIEIAEGKLTLTSAGRVASLMTLPIAEFPEMGVRPTDWVTIDGTVLARAIEGVAFAVSDDSTRYVLNGIHFTDDALVVATDGKRLARMSYAGHVASVPGPLDGIILPTQALAALVEIFGRGGAMQVGGDTEEGGITFRTLSGDEEYYTRKIEGRYPNFSQVIPSFNAPVTVKVARAAMLHALAWARLYRNKLGTVKLHTEGGHLVITATSPEVGEAVERIDLLTPVKGNFVCTLDLDYLTDMVDRDGGEAFQIVSEPDLNTGVVLSPLLVREDSEDFLGLLMPMRTM